MNQRVDVVTRQTSAVRVMGVLVTGYVLVFFWLASLKWSALATNS